MGGFSTIVGAGKSLILMSTDELISDFIKQQDNSYIADLLYETFTPSFAITLFQNLNANRVQSILYAMVDKMYFDRVIEIITYDAPNMTVTGTTTVSGVVRYKNLVVSSGATLTVGGQPGVIIASEISNMGTISKSATGGAGGTTPSLPGRGGNGGGGLIIIAKNVLGGTFQARGESGESGGLTDTWCSGGSGGNGLMVRVGTDSPGNGGSAVSGTTGGGGGSPGGGGGGGISTAFACNGGSGGTISLVTVDSYTTIATETLKAACDWFIVNVLGKTPTTTKSFYNCYGAGGGGGAEYDRTGDSGGGGGSGGQIIVVADMVSGGTYDVSGGNGGNGGNEGAWDNGGGGGGGGIVYVLAKRVWSVPTFNASGGAGGTGDQGTAGSGTSGTAKLILI